MNLTVADALSDRMSDNVPKAIIEAGPLTRIDKGRRERSRFPGESGWVAALMCSATLLLSIARVAAGENLLKNPGFEEAASGTDSLPSWATRADSAGRAMLTEKGPHSGQRGVAIPADTAVEQKIDSAAPGAYVARCWVKSESEQPITLLLQDTDRPWAAYTCAEVKVPKNQWTQIEAFCVLDKKGSLTLTVGGTSKDFRFYHGVAAEMRAPIIADDFELSRYERKAPTQLASVAAWDSKKELVFPIDWSTKGQWSRIEDSAHVFSGSAVLQGGQLLGAVRKDDGALVISSVQADGLKPRCVIAPVPALTATKSTMVTGKDRTGIRVSSPTGDRSYTAWFTSKGLVSVEANQVKQFQVRDCRLRHGLLPSFAGTDICYTPATMPAGKEFCIPSTQWFVGLVDGNESMLVAVWEKDSQAVSLGLAGAGSSRLIDSLSIATEKAGFSLSFVEHPGLWHQETLKEDWLGDYVPIGWQRPFQARWMSHFFVSPGGRPSFREPYLDYSFPIADAKTRMWGVWFEDWNHYPFFFDGPRTVFHFEKTFVPAGDALIYFLQPAAADLSSPCEIVEQALGEEKAAALFDFDANRLRKLKYSTPDLFIYDRPVCATTTRLSKIKKEEKPTVGVNLATHLYEFIREIRGRVDQYVAFFSQISGYLAGEKKAHPELRDYLSELEGMVAEDQSKSKEIYETPLPSVEKKTGAMKKLLEEGKGDGFDCGNLDVRETAGSQDDLCRWYNRRVMRLAQYAAAKCGDSPEKAVVAKYIWDQSRAVLRQPTRWESRRTLYFFEP